ncbi:hypothetical protein G7046_g1332 [Stylonectria norvegica]|nr:hypothetical protein G7046_g1332 [Stylonectria norvegica]
MTTQTPRLQLASQQNQPHVRETHLHFTETHLFLSPSEIQGPCRQQTGPGTLGRASVTLSGRITVRPSMRSGLLRVCRIGGAPCCPRRAVQPNTLGPSSSRPRSQIQSFHRTPCLQPLAGHRPFIRYPPWRECLIVSAEQLPETYSPRTTLLHLDHQRLVPSIAAANPRRPRPSLFVIPLSSIVVAESEKEKEKKQKAASMCTYYYLHHHHFPPCTRSLTYLVHYQYCVNAMTDGVTGQQIGPCDTVVLNDGAPVDFEDPCASGGCLASPHCDSGQCRLEDLQGLWMCCQWDQRTRQVRSLENECHQRQDSIEDMVGGDYVIRIPQGLGVELVRPGVHLNAGRKNICNAAQRLDEHLHQTSPNIFGPVPSTSSLPLGTTSQGFVISWDMVVGKHHQVHYFLFSDQVVIAPPPFSIHQRPGCHVGDVNTPATNYFSGSILARVVQSRLQCWHQNDKRLDGRPDVVSGGRMEDWLKGLSRIGLGGIYRCSRHLDVNPWITNHAIEFFASTLDFNIVKCPYKDLQKASRTFHASQTAASCCQPLSRSHLSYSSYSKSDQIALKERGPLHNPSPSPVHMTIARRIEQLHRETLRGRNISGPASLESIAVSHHTMCHQITFRLACEHLSTVYAYCAVAHATGRWPCNNVTTESVPYPPPSRYTVPRCPLMDCPFEANNQAWNCCWCGKAWNVGGRCNAVMIHEGTKISCEHLCCKTCTPAREYYS